MNISLNVSHNLPNILFFYQGPVEKFFSFMYGKNPAVMGERAELQAIRLWSDWNTGLKKWAKKRVETVCM